MNILQTNAQLYPCSKEGLQLPLNTYLMPAPPGTSRCRNTEIPVLPGN